MIWREEKPFSYKDMASRCTGCAHRINAVILHIRVASQYIPKLCFNTVQYAGRKAVTNLEEAIPESHNTPD
jgi:hypothetical protein